MKNLLFMAVIVLALTSCKDVEKNPSGCEYDYIETSDGKCTSISHLIKSAKTENSTNYYRSPILAQYVKQSQFSNDFEINYENINNEFLTDNPLKSYVEFVSSMKSYIESIQVDIEKIDRLYQRDSTNSAYEERTKLENLKSALETISQSTQDLSEVYRNYESSDDISQYSSLLTKMNNLMKIREDKESFRIELAQDGRGYQPQLSIVTYELSSDRDEMVDALNENLSNNDECSDRVTMCVEDLKSDVRNHFYNLYLTVFYNI